MNLEEAKNQAKLIFKSDLDFENTGGVKYVLRQPAEGEELKPGPTPDTVICRDGIKAQRKDGRILLGAGNSWLTAMRQATKKRLEDMQTANKAKQELNQKMEQEAQVRLSKFMQFLQDKFEKEFEASLETKPNEASPTVP